MLEGYYEFKFSADNWSISESLDPSWGCTNGNAQYTNRTLVVDENRVICPEWGLCTPVCNSVIISGISESDALEVSLYPNPSPGLFSIKKNVFSEIRIINALGKTVYKNDALKNVKSISLRHLPSGIYQCVLASEFKRLVQKIQIIK
jgi:hypothetical protein